MASGALSAGTITSTSIIVNYSFSSVNGNVGLFLGGTLKKNCGSGSGSGSYSQGGLQPNTGYTFYLKYEQAQP